MRTTKGTRPIDASNLARRIREYMDDFPNATTRLATCRAILSILGDENQRMQKTIMDAVKGKSWKCVNYLPAPPEHRLPKTKKDSDL